MDLKILISAPADQTEEVKIALEAVEHLNTILEIHGHSIHAKHWQKNISTGRGNRAQDVINDQAEECDAIVAIIGPRLGTPTGEYESGTVEEIYRFLNRTNATEVSYDVHVFFNAKDLGNPLEINAAELARVQQFRSSLNDKGISFAQFSTNEILRNLIQVGLNTLVGKSKPYVEPEECDPLEEFDELGSDDAIEIAAEKLDLANKSAGNIATSMNTMNTKLTELTALSPGKSGASDYTKKFLLDGANILDEARRDLGPLIRTMRDNFEQAYAYMNLAITIAKEDATVNDQNADFGSLSTSISEAVTMAKTTFDTFVSTRKSLEKIPRRTKELRKAKKGLDTVYGEMLDALESFVSDFGSLNNTINN